MSALAAQAPATMPTFAPYPLTDGERDALKLAQQLALNGPSRNENPQVGCVVLDAAGRSVGQGWHNGKGTDHAETAAIWDAHRKGANLQGATVVVSREPCAHYGLTPPCTDLLINSGINRVIYGEPEFSDIARGGARQLRDAGIDVIAAGPPAIAKQGYPRPHIVAKWAMTLDGRVAAHDGSSQWITGLEAREHAHRNRALVDAIVVGSGTVEADDPSLTVRVDGEQRSPLRVVVGERGIAASAKMLTHGPSVLVVPSRDPHALIAALQANSVRTAFVEGGPVLTTALLQAGLIDALHVYIAPKLLGSGRSAVEDLDIPSLSFALGYAVSSVLRLGDDVFLELVPRVEQDSSGA